jgi:hypothetical protein
MPFAAVLDASLRPLVIPLFQRRYCWRKQVPQWFRDTTGLAGRNQAYALFGHGTGKCFFYRPSRHQPDCGEDVLLLVDGQQRVTTTLLLLAALRDAALALAHAATAAGLPVPEAARDAAAYCNRLLFRSPPDAAACAARIAAEAEPVAALLTAFPDGGRPPFAPMLLPSFYDRRPFFLATFAGVVAHVLPAAAAAAALAAALEGDSLQSEAKAEFDRMTAEALEQHCPGTLSAELVEARAALLRRMAGAAAEQTSIVSCEFLTPVSIGVVFQHLQEKSLFSQAALLHNPSPGREFRVSDLARNLLLLPFMDLPLAAQEAHFREVWLPLESSAGSPNALDDALARFLRRFAARTGRHESFFEATFKKISATGMFKSFQQVSRKDSRGLAQFSQFVSFVESVELASFPQADAGQVNLSLSPATCADVAAKLLRFISEP